MSLGNIVDELHNKHSLSNSSSSKESNFASLLVGRQHIYDLQNASPSHGPAINVDVNMSILTSGQCYWKLVRYVPIKTIFISACIGNSGNGLSSQQSIRKLALQGR